MKRTAAMLMIASAGISSMVVLRILAGDGWSALSIALGAAAVFLAGYMLGKESA